MAGRVAPRAPHLRSPAKPWLFVAGRRRARSDAPYQPIYEMARWLL